MAPKSLRAVFTCLLRQSRPLWTMCCQPRVPIELSSVFSNSSTVVKRSLAPRHSGVEPEGLMALTPGFDWRKVANNSLRAADSDPDVHHDTTSSCLVLVAGLVGDWLPHALTAAAAAAATTVTRQRRLTPLPRRLAAAARRSAE